MDRDKADAEERWCEHFNALPEESVRSLQHSWETFEIQKKTTTIQSSLVSTADKARFSANLFPESGAWLQALPSPQLGTHLSNDEFRISVSLRLGTQIVQPHKCVCGSKVDAFGRHGLSCTKAAGTTPRHESANNLLQRALKSAEVPCVREPPGCSRSDGKRPDGLTLVPWKRGESLLWDYTCGDTFAQSYVNRTSREPGYVAKEAEKYKYGKYNDLMDTFVFVPVASETSGIIGSVGLAFLKTIGSMITRVTHEKRASAYLIQRISLVIQRGNVASIMGTIPSSKNLGEIFYLSGDVVTAKNGLSIEFQQTDKEAPLVLVDAILYAENFDPKFIVDVGTLHNDMKGALGEAASGVFTSTDEMWQGLKAAAVHTGDRVWRMPVWNYYTGLVKNSCSVDIQNVGQVRGGGSCKAAAILREFVPNNVDWMHVDAMGVMTTNGNPFAYLKGGMSGRPTRTIIEFLAKGIKLDANVEKKISKNFNM